MVVSVANKVVLITGASQGIGKAIAVAFAREGARLVLAARSAERLAQAEAEVGALGAEVLAVPTDVSSDGAVAAMVETAMGRFGRVDVLINNAGIARFGGIGAATFEDDVRDTLQASLFGMISVTRRVLPIMRRQGSGAIVNMSSVMGRKAVARFGSYATVMHAVSGFSDSLRQEVAADGIQVSVIYPALTSTALLQAAKETDMPPPFRYITPMPVETVAAAVLTAVRHGRPRVVLPRSANLLLLGEALSPRLGDRFTTALTARWVARLLGMSSGTTFHQTISPPA